MNVTVASIFEEIEEANEDALAALIEAVREPEVGEAFKRLYRFIETWELKLLTSHIGEKIGLETLMTLQGALAAFQLQKSLLVDLRMNVADAPERHEERGNRFVESLLHPSSKPTT